MRSRCLFAVLCLALSRPAAAQLSPRCAAAPVGTRAELVQRLISAVNDPAVLAMHGRPVVDWALELAADSTAEDQLRARALVVLRHARWKSAMPELMRLAQPLRGRWVVWRGALSALAAYPYEELTPYWLDLIRFPRRVVREDALRGLSLSADARVLPMVKEATSHEEDPAMRELVAAIETRLRLPQSLRDTLTFGWPPDSAGGRFVPSRAWLQQRGCPLASARRSR